MRSARIPHVRRATVLEVGGLAVLLGAALLLRVTGIGTGAPFVYHPDEWAIVQPAHAMIRNRDWNPHWFDWPSLSIYAYVPIAAAIRLITRAPLDTPTGFTSDGLPLHDPSDAFPEQFPYFLFGRLLVALLGVATVALVYVAARVHAGRTAGFAAATFVAFATLHVEHSRYLTPDVPSTAVAALVLMLAAVAARTRRPLWLVASGLAAGMAGGAKWNAALTGVVPLVVWIAMAARESVSRRRLVSVAAAIVVAGGVGIVLATPALLLDTTSVLQAIAGVREHYFVIGHPGAEGADNGPHYLRFLFSDGIGPGLFIAAVGGIVAAILRRRPLDLAAVAFVGLYFAITSLSIVRFERNLLPLFPYLAFLAGCLAALIRSSAADALASLTGRRPLVRSQLGPMARPVGAAVVGILLVVAAYPQGASAWRQGIAMDLPDTRTLAYEWLEASLPEGARIVREDYTPQVGGPKFEVGFVLSLTDRPLEWYREHGYSFAIASSYRYQRYFDGRYPEIQSGYERLFALPLLHEQCPDAAARGPCVRVIALTEGPIAHGQRRSSGRPTAPSRSRPPAEHAEPRNDEPQKEQQQHGVSRVQYGHHAGVYSEQ
jgi:4-amino-4-deoxy-L-arabinose transferase-like glycosyltransferase